MVRRRPHDDATLRAVAVGPGAGRPGDSWTRARPKCAPKSQRSSENNQAIAPFGVVCKTVGSVDLRVIILATSFFPRAHAERAGLAARDLPRRVGAYRKDGRDSWL